ncbi:MAG: hypothetical protein OEV99_00055 [Nitrospira sp.]|nr:hypothetical protein [Nitrospira sp.]MDH4368204.1 hypothetical protein [Nitrospira sp.]MDH5495888.1 hypothetical protein [Nitrospira sp.]MDH5723957.1 hypothetical protein [Nitrospira sp.]
MSAIPDPNQTEPPLWSIGIVVAIILTAPLVLYSLAPTGPLREGDTVFSAGQQRVRIETTTADKQNEVVDTCLLDPDSPLIVIHTSNTDDDLSIIAEVQGNPVNEWPFCPVHAEVRVESHQLFQKPAAFDGVRELLARIFNR